MKRIVYRIVPILTCFSILLSVFILPVYALEDSSGVSTASFDTVNFITPTGGLPPFHTASSGGLIDVFILNTNGYGYMIEFTWSNPNLTFYPFWGTGGYVTNTFGFCYSNPTGVPQECSYSYYIYAQDGSLYKEYSDTETFKYKEVNDAYYPYMWQWSTPYSVAIPGGFGGYAYSWFTPIIVADVYYSNDPTGRLINSSAPLGFNFTVNESISVDGSTNTGAGEDLGGSVDMTETNSWLERIYNKLCDIFTFLPELKNSSNDELLNAAPSSPLDDDVINDYKNAVGDIDTSISDNELSSITSNIDMSGSAIEWIYNELENFVQGNNKVFSIYMSIMAMSLIMFVLNKGSNFRGV